jgi:hypothetical protein
MTRDDVEMIPFRWLVAVFGPERAYFFNDHPEQIPPDTAAALLALWSAMYGKNYPPQRKGFHARA